MVTKKGLLHMGMSKSNKEDVPNHIVFVNSVIASIIQVSAI
jgi:hypothetical protein